MLLVLFNPYTGPYQVLPPRARMDLEAMAIKGYSAFPKAPALLETHHQIVYCHIQDTRWVGWGLTPLQRSSQCILQPQPTGQAQNELTNIYLKNKQTEYIQNQIDKIIDSVEDRQSRVAWQTKWAERRALWKLNWKLTAKKNK